MATERRTMLSQTFRVVLVAWLMGGALAGTAVAGPFEDGKSAFDRGDHAQAARMFREAAERGMAIAKSVLGSMYANGEGVPQDYAEALKWFRKAAEQGDEAGQYNLGSMCHDGTGVPQDYSKAEMWFRRAAEQGSGEAQNSLGHMYDHGRGVRQDYAEAVRWYRKAAEGGTATGQTNLGTMYLNGAGVPQDYVQAYMWLELAVARYDADDPEDLQLPALAVKERDLVAAKMTPADISKAQMLAREWKPKKWRCPK